MSQITYPAGALVSVSQTCRDTKPGSDADPGITLSRVTAGPEQIWLVYGDIERDATHADVYAAGDVGWCDAPQFASDVRYVRADVFERERASRQAAQIENEALKAERARSGLELQRSVREEREACAKVCDETPPYPFRASIEAAHAIRARGKERAPSNGWPDTDAERSAEG